MDIGIVLTRLLVVNIHQRLLAFSVPSNAVEGSPLKDTVTKSDDKWDVGAGVAPCRFGRLSAFLP